MFLVYFWHAVDTIAYLPTVEKVPSIVSAVDAVFLVVIKQGGTTYGGFPI